MARLNTTKAPAESAFARSGAMLIRCGDGLSDRVIVLLLLSACLAFAALRWLHLGTLWGDGPLWMFVSARAYAGEMPFRDFMSSYPPFSVWLFQFSFAALGQTFIAAQLVVDVLSAAVVCLTFAIAKFVLPRILAFGAAFVFLLLGDTGFQLFTLKIYSAALLPGAVGLQLMTLGMIRYGEDQRWTAADFLLVFCGAMIAILSKPEFMAAAFGLLAAGAVLAVRGQRRKGGFSFSGVILAAAPAFLGCALSILVFYLVGKAAGGDRMVAGLSGYGLAKITCPWWPTGLGLYDALGALAQAIALVGLLSLLRARHFMLRYTRLYPVFLAVAAAAAVFYVASALSFITGSQAAQNYLQTARGMGNLLGLGSSGQVMALGGYFLTKRNIFLPVVWTAVAAAIYYALRMLFGSTKDQQVSAPLFLVLVAACALSARQFFGDYAEAYSNVAVAAFPYLYILVIVFLFHAVRLVWEKSGGAAAAAGVAVMVVVLIAAAYALPRALISSWKEMRASYGTVQTVAGPIGLDDREAAAIYRYVHDHLKPGQTVLDIGSNQGASYYGGGVNFAMNRTSPVASTIFTDVQPPQSLMAEDLRRVRAAPPGLVIGTDPLQSKYGLGNAWNRCPFPALVWAPHIANFDDNRRIPVVGFVQANYVKVYQSGRWAVFAPRG